MRPESSNKKARISGHFCHSGAAAPLRIFFVSSPSGRCPAETANFLLLLAMSYHCPIMIGGLAGVEPAFSKPRQDKR